MQGKGNHWVQERMRGHAVRDTLALHQKVFPNHHQWASDHTFRNGAPRLAVPESWLGSLHLPGKLQASSSPYYTHHTQGCNLTDYTHLVSPPPPSCPPVSVKSSWGWGEVYRGKSHYHQNKTNKQTKPNFSFGNSPILYLSW